MGVSRGWSLCSGSSTSKNLPDSHWPSLLLPPDLPGSTIGLPLLLAASTPKIHSLTSKTQLDRPPMHRVTVKIPVTMMGVRDDIPHWVLLALHVCQQVRQGNGHARYQQQLHKR